MQTFFGEYNAMKVAKEQGTGCVNRLNIENNNN